MRISLLSILCICLFSGTTLAADYGDGVASYSTAYMPDKPAVNTTRYYPSSNDAAGINAAIDAANAAGGGTVKLSTMTYTINSPIVMKSKVRLLGDGIGKTIIKRGASFPTTSSVMVGADNGSVSDAEIRSMSVDGNYSRAELETEPQVLIGVGFRSDNSHRNIRIRVIYVEVEGCTIGIQMNGTSHITVQSCDIHDNGGTYLHHNVYFRRVGVALFYRNDIYDSVQGSGLKLAGGTTNFPEESRYFIIRQNDIFDNARINLNIQGCHHMLIEDNRLESQIDSSPSYLAGLYMVSYLGYQCRYSDVINNEVVNNEENGMYIRDLKDVNVEGNATLGNGTNYNISGTSSFYCDYNTSY